MSPANRHARRDSRLALMRDRNVTSWLAEFGYPENFAGLNQAINERGRGRVSRELAAHDARRKVREYVRHQARETVSPR
jgi:hypothetical protein